MMFKRRCLYGGLIGFFIPAALFGILSALSTLDIEFARNPVTYSLVIGLTLIELPMVALGRSLRLPIENGGAAFMLYDLNVFGYILILLFWAFAGALLGLIFYRKPF